MHKTHENILLILSILVSFSSAKLKTMILTIIFFSVLVLLFITLIKFLQRVWWNPIQIEKLMGAQGIKGPKYNFLHGSTKEAAAMVRESMSRPLMEFSHDIAPRVQPYLHAWVKAYGKNILKWHGPTPQLVITEPELIKEVLNNREGAYIKAPPPNPMKNLIGDGLVISEGKKWARQRKLANHAFRADNVKGMIPAIVTSVEDMLKKWTEYNGKEVDLFQEFHVMASDAISRTAFSSSYIQGKDIFTMLNKLATIAARNLETLKFPLLRKLLRNEDDKESDKIAKEIREIIIRIIKKREESNVEGDPEGYGRDLLGLLVKAYHSKNRDERVTLDDIIDECKTFYFAGEETTTVLLTWTSLLLAINADWQDKAREEAREFFGDKPVTIDDANNIARLKTITMILNESLRLYPPVVLIIREVAKEVKLGNFLLPPGLEVHISPLIVHHEPQLWGDDASQFKPERFSEGIAKATNNTMSYLPFGAGPRYCVGQILALMEAKIALAMILTKYSFALSPVYVHAPMKHLTSIPQYGVQVILHKL